MGVLPVSREIAASFMVMATIFFAGCARNCPCFCCNESVPFAVESTLEPLGHSPYAEELLDKKFSNIAMTGSSSSTAPNAEQAMAKVETQASRVQPAQFAQQEKKDSTSGRFFLGKTILSR